MTDGPLPSWNQSSARAAILDFVARVTDPRAPWLVVRRVRGPQEATDALKRLLDGQVDPRDGLMLAL